MPQRNVRSALLVVLTLLGCALVSLGAAPAARAATAATAAAAAAASDPAVAPPLVAPLLVTVSPTAGPSTGGGSATLSLDDPGAVTGVTFGGTTATVTSRDPLAGTLTVTMPPHAAGTVVVAVTTVDGQSDDQPDAGATDRFTYADGPYVTGLDATSGGPEGGQRVTVTGFGFSGAVAVTVGGVPATDVVVDSGTQVRLTTPPGSGLADVRVDASPVSVGDVFRYRSSFAVTGVYPPRGPATGGGTVTVTGRGLAGATAVRFGGVAATLVRADPAGDQLTVTAPAQPVGDVLVEVEQGSAVTQPDDEAAALFTVVPAGPGLTYGVLRHRGPAKGGSTLVLSGVNLADATSVTFGDVTTTAVFATPDGRNVYVTVPPHAPGAVAVSVTTPAGTTPAQTGLRRRDVYTFVGAPRVDALAYPDLGIGTTPGPYVGATDGGTFVVVTGSGVAGGQVQFGGVPALDAFPLARDTVRVRTPAHSAGTVPVTVTTAAGTSSTSVPFTYLADPGPGHVYLGSQASSPVDGGVQVVLYDSSYRYGHVGLGSFAGTTSVEVGGAAAAFQVYSYDADQLLVTLPAHAAGSAAVVVRTADGGVSLPDADPADDHVVYGAAPVVTALGYDFSAPLRYSSAGGDTLYVLGQGFTGATGVAFGGTPGTVTAVTDTRVTVRTPAHAPGEVAVTVTTPNGTNAPLRASDPRQGFQNHVSDRYTYNAWPAVTSVRASKNATGQARGPVAGGTALTLTGYGLASATQVLVGGTPVTFTATAGTAGLYPVDTVTLTTPAHAAGLVYVRVVTPDGTSVGTTLADSAEVTHQDDTVDTFLYVDHPLAALSAFPTRGPAAGGTSVTLTGAQLDGATEVDFGDVPGTITNVSSDGTALSVTTPAHVGGAAPVTVVTPLGRSAPVGASPDAPTTFTFVDGPVIDAVVYIRNVSGSSPFQGQSATGGRLVYVYGAGFDDSTTVTVGGIQAVVEHVGESSMHITLPDHAPGPVAVVATNARGSSPPSVFVYEIPPRVDSISPTSGPASGGTVVTVRGANLMTVTAAPLGGFFGGLYDIVVSPDGTTLTGTTTRVDLQHGPPAASPLSLTATHGERGAVYDSVDVDRAVVDYPTSQTFTYLPVPQVLTVSPASGGPGTRVTLTGDDLTGATRVLFGSVPGTGVTVSADGTSLTVTAPAPRTVGPVQVTVTTPDGTSAPVDGYGRGGSPVSSVFTYTTGVLAGPADVPVTAPQVGPARTVSGAPKVSTARAGSRGGRSR